MRILAVVALAALPLIASAQYVSPSPIQHGITGSQRDITEAPNVRHPVAVSQPPADRSGECDAVCLKGVADQYLDALAKRDYSNLPVAANLLVAENSHTTRIGAGMWKVLEKLSADRTYLTDPLAGQVLVLTTYEMSAEQPVILLLRLKVENRRIAEVESMATQDLIAAQHFRPDHIAKFDPVAMAVLPAAKRATRQQLLAMADTMWTGRGEPLQAAPDCVHWENGDRLVKFRCSTSEVTPAGPAYTNRLVRHALVDVERGLVVTYALKDSAPYLNPDPPDDERTPIFYQHPLTLYFVAIVKFEAGGIETVQHNFMNAQEANAPAVFVE